MDIRPKPSMARVVRGCGVHSNNDHRLGRCGMKRWGSGLGMRAREVWHEEMGEWSDGMWVDNNYQLGRESMRATQGKVFLCRTFKSRPNSTPLTVKQTLSQMLFAVGGV